MGRALCRPYCFHLRPSDLLVSDPAKRGVLITAALCADDDELVDLYVAHRRDAARLSRQWQRGMHRAAAAFAAGDSGAAHRLAAEARRVR